MNLLEYHRKVQHIGKSFLLTLPKAWCNNKGVFAGKELLIRVQDSGELLIGTKNEQPN